MPSKKSKPRIRLQLVDAEGAEIDELLTVKQAASRLGYADSHVPYLCRMGKIANYELTQKCTLVSKRDVEAIIEARDDPDRERRGRKRMGRRRTTTD
jgi:hypothetical protein